MDTGEAAIDSPVFQGLGRKLTIYMVYHILVIFQIGQLLESF